MFRAFTILLLAALITGAASLVSNSGHALGTGANDWDFRSFGWPVEIWSRTKHTYQTVTVTGMDVKRETIEYPTKYSVNWTNAGLVYGGALFLCHLVGLWVGRQRNNKHSYG